jgi:glyoxylase-like metal-dependent hydrolase (beta-lactamase superfamily II)
MDDKVITPGELKRRLDADAVSFIFDLRNEDEFKSWRIEGHKEIETLNLPQEDFVGEEERHMDKLPKDRQIITICAHGDSSKYTAELLREKGFDAITLLGGMDIWSEFYESHKVADLPEIYQIYRVAKGCIAYLVTSGGEAAIIDAPRHVETILDLAKTLDVKITQVFDTHLHADHISGGREVARRTGAAYHIHPADMDGATYDYNGLRDGSSFTIGNSVLKVVHSPGHTPGSASFFLDNAFLFTGDIIMKTNLGRPDLGGLADPWAAQLFDTLFNKFGPLSDATVIMPSHATSIREQDRDGVVKTTLGITRQQSDLFQLKDFPAFLAKVKASLPESPERYQEIRKVNLGLIDPDEKKLKELEIGKNLCGMAKKE